MRVLLLVLFFVVNLFAFSQSELLEKVKENPEILETPQAQIYLRQNGLNKEDMKEALKMILNQ